MKTKTAAERLNSPTAFRAAGSAALCFLLASCATPQTASTDLDGPVWDSSKPTTVVIATDDVIHVRDLAKVARVIGHYKTLDAAERALVKSSVAKRLHGLIALEVERVEARHQAERTKIARLSDHALATQRLTELNETIRREATAIVLRRLGNLVAVPLKTSDNRSAVAFARIGGPVIEVAADASEIDHPIASLIDGARVQAGAGTVASLMQSPPAVVAASR